MARLYTITCKNCGVTFVRDVLRKACSPECAAALIRAGVPKRSGPNAGNYRHGATALTVPGRKSPEYNSWRAMKARCLNPKDQSYGYYGGRGIKIYEPWINDFAAFYNYVGPRPTPQHTLDRYPNNDGNYEPGNVRWATRQEQSDNQRDRKLLTLCKAGLHERSPETRIGTGDGRCLLCYLARYRSDRNSDDSAGSGFVPGESVIWGQFLRNSSKRQDVSAVFLQDRGLASVRILVAGHDQRTVRRASVRKRSE